MVWPISGTTPEVMHLERLRKATKYISRDSWQLSQDANWTPHKYTYKLKVVLLCRLALKKKWKDIIVGYLKMLWWHSLEILRKTRKTVVWGYYLSTNLQYCYSIMLVHVLDQDQTHTFICSFLLIIASVNGTARVCPPSTDE